MFQVSQPASNGKDVRATTSHDQKHPNRDAPHATSQINGIGNGIISFYSLHKYQILVRHGEGV